MTERHSHARAIGVDLTIPIGVAKVSEALRAVQTVTRVLCVDTRETGRFVGTAALLAATDKILPSLVRVETLLRR